MERCQTEEHVAADLTIQHDSEAFLLYSIKEPRGHVDKPEGNRHSLGRGTMRRYINTGKTAVAHPDAADGDIEIDGHAGDIPASRVIQLYLHGDGERCVEHNLRDKIGWKRYIRDGDLDVPDS